MLFAQAPTVRVASSADEQGIGVVLVLGALVGGGCRGHGSSAERIASALDDKLQAEEASCESSSPAVFRCDVKATDSLISGAYEVKTTKRGCWVATAQGDGADTEKQSGPVGEQYPTIAGPVVRGCFDD
jgi:hypothetical protein